MGEAMEAADPNMKTTLLKCMRQPATTLSVQMSAIQAFRRMSVTPEVSIAGFVQLFIFLKNQLCGTNILRLTNFTLQSFSCSGPFQHSESGPLCQRCCSEETCCISSLDEKARVKRPGGCEEDPYPGPECASQVLCGFSCLQHYSFQGS